MHTQVQNNVIEAINMLIKTLSEEQKIALLNKLNLETTTKKPKYNQEIINTRKISDSYLFKGNDFEKVSKQMLDGEKVDFEKFKKTC